MVEGGSGWARTSVGTSDRHYSRGFASFGPAPAPEVDGAGGVGGFTRTDFLRRCGLLAAGLGVPSGLSLLGPASAVESAEAARRKVPSKPFRVAVLRPTSRLAPQLGAGLLAGVRLRAGSGTSFGGRRAEVFAVDVGSGERSGLEAVERLLKNGGADLALGVSTPARAARLGEVLGRRRVPFVSLDAGLDVARAGEKAAPLTGTLLAWRASRALGEWAFRNLGPTAAVVTSVYESGYDAPYAFRVGFEGAGGEVLETHVTHRPEKSENGLASALRAVVGRRPAFVYAAYCGRPAVEFLREYERSGAKGSVPLAGSAFLTEEGVLAQSGTAALGAYSASTWFPALGGSVNSEFVGSYTRRHGRAPDLFAMLGFEVAGLAAAAVRLSGGARDRAAFGRSLSRAASDGPRGRTGLAARTAPALHLAQVRRSRGTTRNAAVRKLSATVPEGQLAALTDGLKTGWVHAYPVL